MKIIGITGPSGSGKGMCCEYFRSLGLPCIDTDHVYHDLLLPPSECAQELVLRFGNSILNEDQTINRSQLASVVFSDKTGCDIDDLNRIAHKYVKEKTLTLLDEFNTSGQCAAVVDAPLLFEAEFDAFCDFTIAVLANRELRLDRIMKRDSLSCEKAEARLSAQKKDTFYISKATYILYNNGEYNELYSQLRSILDEENITIET